MLGATWSGEPRANWQRGLLSRLPTMVARVTGSIFLTCVCRWYGLYILMRDICVWKSGAKKEPEAATRGFCVGMLSCSLAICWPYTRRFADSGTDLRPQAVVSGWGVGGGRGICCSLSNNHLPKFSSSVWCQSDYLVPQIKSAPLPPLGFPSIINTKHFWNLGRLQQQPPANNRERSFSTSKDKMPSPGTITVFGICCKDWIR